MFGPYEGPFLTDQLVELGEAMASGEPAPDPYPFDAENGVAPDGPPYPEGAASGTLTEQPQASVPRFGHARIAWSGGPMGHDRPLERAFVVVERRRAGRWKRVDSDLGLAILWRVDDAGAYTPTGRSRAARSSAATGSASMRPATSSPRVRSGSSRAMP